METRLEPGERRTLTLCVGVGLEETSAVASAIDIERHGWENLFADLASWLDDHTLSVKDDVLDEKLNLNSFFNYFFSTGMTIDTEEMAVVASRSPRYHSTAVYRDRDAMRWTLPSVLQVDPPHARKMIEHAFTKQLRNTGIRSRYLNGVVATPGFQLDGLCAPIRGLSVYVRTTKDISILFDRRVQTGVNRTRHILASKMHPTVGMFETTISPSGEPSLYPYVTHSNAVAWRLLRDLAWMYELIHDLDRSDENKELAKKVHDSIMKHCVVDGPFGPMFAFSVDLQGNFEIGDDPTGTLELLAWLEFCPPDLPAYRNTVEWIHSELNPNSFRSYPFSAPGSRDDRHPSVIGAASSLVAGHIDRAREFIMQADMDEGIACQSVDEVTGKAATGYAFAAGAGYLAYAINSAFGGKKKEPGPEAATRLYEPPPSDVLDIEVKRM